jgi:hypothetical protein
MYLEAAGIFFITGNLQKIVANKRGKRSDLQLFAVGFTPPPPSHHGSVWLLPVISLVL